MFASYLSPEHADGGPVSSGPPVEHMDADDIHALVVISVLMIVIFSLGLFLNLGVVLLGT